MMTGFSLLHVMLILMRALFIKLTVELVYVELQHMQGYFKRNTRRKYMIFVCFVLVWPSKSVIILILIVQIA